jgi:hypothetical protein
MNIIRDEDSFGLFMLPLFIDWGIKRCNEKGCKDKPTTIIAGMGDGIPVFGLCEEHFQRCNQDDGGAMVHLEFDDFDAFAKESNQS